MAYTEKQYNNTTLHYYKWNDSDGEPPSPYKLMIDWQDRYSIEDLSRLSCNEKLRGKKASLLKLLVKNFKIEKDEAIDGVITLEDIYFMNDFIVKGCRFTEQLALFRIKVFGDCQITFNTFNSFILHNSIITNILQIRDNNEGIFRGIINLNIVNNFNFSFNKAESLSILDNKIVEDITFLGNSLSSADIRLINFIDPIEIELTNPSEIKYHNIKIIPPSQYFKNLKNIKKVNLKWEYIRISLCNLKSYYSNNHDYYTSKIFEDLERKSYFQSRINRKNWPIIAWISTAHFIEYFAKYIYVGLAFIATIATIIEAL